MTKKRPIERVASLAKSRENKAAKTLAENIGRHKQETEKHRQIRTYRVEYETHLNGLQQAGVDARTLSEYRQFLGNLDDAIDQQSSIVRNAEKVVGESRSDWLNRYHRTSALEQLVELQAKERRQAADKKLQKELDESALRKSASQR